MIAGQTAKMVLFLLLSHKWDKFLRLYEFTEFCFNIYHAILCCMLLIVIFGADVFVSYQHIFRNQLNHHSLPRRSNHAVHLSSHKLGLRLNLMVILYQQLNGSVKTSQSKAQLICRYTRLAQSQY